MRYVVLISLLFSACTMGPRSGEPAKDLYKGPISSEKLLAHLGYLASDSLYGRGAGSPHEAQAARYIRGEFQRYGLQPAVPGYHQPFPFVARVEMGVGNALRWQHGGAGEPTELEPDVDFRPLGFSASGKVAGELVFVGYGISSTDPEFNDYAELDVAGRVVMVLRFTPDGTNPHGPFGEHSPVRKKVLTAREQGAAAVLVVTGPAEDEEDYLMRLTYDRVGGDAGLPVVNLTRRVADRLLASQHLTIAELQKEINDTRMPLSFELPGVQVSLTTDLVPKEAESRNVLAALPGAGSLKGQWIVLGAHYDHLGMGGPGSGSMVPETTAVHNGADDNASGTSALMEIARYLATHPPGDGNRRSIMFQAFGAEERGVLGSMYVTRNSPVPMDSVAAMINMDMVGGLSENKLVIGGAGTSPLWKELLPSLNSDSLDLAYDDEGFGSSDHQSYYLQDRPVLFFFTGSHERYHRPTDDVEYLNLQGMVQVSQLVARVTENVTTRPAPPVFSKVESSQRATRGGFAVVLGTIPDYTWEGEGMRISGARGGSPADKGGLQAGDIIIHFGETEVKNIYDYMYALQAAKANVPVKIVVKRGEEELQLEVVPERKRD